MTLAAVPVLVVGEALVDVVLQPDGTSVVHPGGSPANVALGLARLGADVVLLTQLGNDDHGDLVRRHLTGDGVRLEEHPAADTSVAAAHLDADGAATYSFDLTWDVPALGSVTQAHVHTGSLASALEPGARRVEDLLSGARAGSTVSYDPNVRPGLQGDHEAAVFRAERFVRLSDVVKASAEDVAWLYPGRAPEAVARDWVAMGPAVVVVTSGEEGAVAVTASGRVLHIAPTPVAVADTVGAGDSFMAALLDGLAKAGLLGAPRRTALRTARADLFEAILARAARAAALTVSRPGADPPTSSELGPLPTVRPWPSSPAPGVRNPAGRARPTPTITRTATAADRERSTT
jgi:fructokinase